MIIDKMKAADGLILASPVYSHMVSALMKNLFDRFGYYAHRPEFFDKYAMSMVTCSGYGGDHATQYMDKMLSVFGFNLAQPLELNYKPGRDPENESDRCNDLFIWSGLPLHPASSRWNCPGTA